MNGSIVLQLSKYSDPRDRFSRHNSELESQLFNMADEESTAIDITLDNGAKI